MSDEDLRHYIHLSNSPTRFEPTSKAINVFYDEVRKQIFTVKANGSAGVIIKGPNETPTSSFKMEDKGQVISIKFSHDLKIVAVQRSQRSVEFMNYFNKDDMSEYSQVCKGKNYRIIGFNWTGTNEIVFVTDHGLELYQVLPEKKSLKSLKNISLNINWFVYMAESSLLITASSATGNVLTPFQFRMGTIMKLPKFDVELPSIPKPATAKPSLLERDVTIANIYGILYVVVLQHQPRGANSKGAEIVLYQLQKEAPAKKTDVLKLNMTGRFAVNVLDNLVVVHHQASKTSMIFDVKLVSAAATSGGVNHHEPVLAPLPIKPVKLKVSGIPTAQGLEMRQVNVELYSPNWAVFQPNIVIDAKLGCLWTVHLNLEAIVAMIPDKERLIDFLLFRRDSKKVILSVIKSALMPGQQLGLATLAHIFDKFNTVCRSHLDFQQQGNMQVVEAAGKPIPVHFYNGGRILIQQPDLYTHVLSPCAENKEVQYKFIVAVLVDYIRSLNQYHIPVQVEAYIVLENLQILLVHFLYELVVNTLVNHNCFYQLHQFLQYHVLSDSKPIACLLLSLESCYPPAHQLALDMLKRVSTANEEIVEVLLSKNQLLPALRFLRSVGGADNASARKFLEAAQNTEDHQLFFTVFKFFEQRNLRLRGDAHFVPGEHCEKFVKHFESLFGYDALGQVA